MKAINSKIRSIGIDVGSSGIRILLLSTEGRIISKRLVSYSEQKLRIWDDKKRIILENLTTTLTDHLFKFTSKLKEISINSIGISSIGPSLVLLSADGQPITPAYTYAYEGAQDYVKLLPDNFQDRTGSLYCGALPYVQLLKLAQENVLKSCYKLTTINDYITWFLTDIPLRDIFSTLPNASYTGLYSPQFEDWDWSLLDSLGLPKSSLPRIIPLGTYFSFSKKIVDTSPFQSTKIVAGAIDGIDAFWATGSRIEDIIVGSASTTGALRRWRNTRKKSFNSRLIQCIQINNDSWVELIPFNNVGTAFNWLARIFKITFRNYLTEKEYLDIERLELSAKKIIESNIKVLEDYLTEIPIFFPYIEGEPRGPNGRGNIKGGFIIQSNSRKACLDLYISFLIGISNMFKHNFDVIFPTGKFREIRLTGQIARKSSLFLNFLATITNLNIVIMKKEQSIAWATGMRSLLYTNFIDDVPTIPTFDPVIPMGKKVKKVLQELYLKYLQVYNSPDDYEIVNSENNLNN